MVKARVQGLRFWGLLGAVEGCFGGLGTGSNAPATFSDFSFAQDAAVSLVLWTGLVTALGGEPHGRPRAPYASGSAQLKLDS